MQSILEMLRAFSARNEIASIVQVAPVCSLESTAIVHNKAIILGRDMLLINTCFTTCGVGDMLKRIINTRHGVDE